MAWSRRPAAPRYLAALSFAESSFFPVPPDVMLVPMTLARPERGLWLAFVTTLASVAGGLAGYLIGYLALELVEPLLRSGGYWGELLTARDWFERWGLWIVFVAGFSPIPYKVFTLSAGALAMPLLPFLAASAVGRGLRFFLLAGLVSRLGPRVEPLIRRYIEWIGWGLVALLAAIAMWLQLAD